MYPFRQHSPLVTTSTPCPARLVKVHSLKYAYNLQNFIADRAKGTYVWTTDGQKHLDMATGLHSSTLPATQSKQCVGFKSA